MYIIIVYKKSRPDFTSFFIVLILIDQFHEFFQDLDEDVVITLTAKNPQAPQNVVRFDHTTGEFVTIKLAESMIDHFEIDSTTIHKDSGEAQAQIQTEGKTKDGSFLFNYCFSFEPSWRHQNMFFLIFR